jgi:hypothetical protein
MINIVNVLFFQPTIINHQSSYRLFCCTSAPALMSAFIVNTSPFVAASCSALSPLHIKR